ncbi:type I restriction-modification system M protein [Streptococcus pneumoniae]|nr:type I restriction-modification system M protein [Streptococcus pneumoniae]
MVEIVRGGSPRPIKDYLTSEVDGINWIKIGDTEKGEKYINNVKEKIKKSGLNKSKSFTPSELAELNYNLDQCGFPKEEEEILNPFELIQNYQAERATLNHKIDNVLADILQLLEDK